MKKRCLILFLLGLASIVSIGSGLSAQEDDGFGFGFGDEEGGTAGALSGAPGVSSGGPAMGAKIGGKVSAGFTFFPDDFLSKEDEGALDRTKQVQLGDIFSGELNFSAGASNADAVINLRLAPNFEDPAKVLSLDEAYIRSFFGKLMLEGGLRKLSWGKSDALGPLDLTNPLDYSDLSNMADFQGIKIARPMIHASWGIGSFTKIEGVFLPWFEGDRFATEGRWASAQLQQVEKMPGRIEGKLFSDLAPMAGMLPPGITMEDLIAIMPRPDTSFPNTGELLPDTSTLEYFQGGLRFTTTLGPADFGAQYYYGLYSRPSYGVNRAAYGNLRDAITAYYAAYVGAYSTALTGGSTPEGAAQAAEAAAKVRKTVVEAAMSPSKLFGIAYNRYHQIAVDYGQVLFGFNTRAELGANVTEDLSGDDGLVYNPALVWSLGFDRDIPVVKINVNLQINENIVLLHDKLGSDSLFDVEAGKKPTSTRLILRLSRTFFRDELELQATGIWGIEDQDCYIMPGIVWTKGDVVLEVSGGIFAGNKEGELGQYRDNYYVKTLLSYSF